MRRNFALLAACAALCLVSIPAMGIEVLATTGPPSVHQGNLGALPLQALLPVAPLSPLPEPEVFAMMLLGLILIGYRASRESNETFK